MRKYRGEVVIRLQVESADLTVQQVADLAGAAAKQAGGVLSARVTVVRDDGGRDIVVLGDNADRRLHFERDGNCFSIQYVMADGKVQWMEKKHTQSEAATEALYQKTLREALSFGWVRMP